MIPLSEPFLNGNEWKYVKECLDANWVSSGGPFVDRFERTAADYVRAGHAVATVNGTAALHAALLVVGVKPGDEVLVSTLTFIAPVNAIHYAGAHPVFMDADPKFWQMDPVKTVEFLEGECQRHKDGLYNRKTGRRVAAILPVHILGHAVDMDPILAVARKYELAVVEDATESLGAEYKGRKVGHLGGDISCLSFNGNKIITTGGGGMLITDNAAYAARARYLTTQAKDDVVEYVHNEVGYNYRLTNVLSAMGVAQMEQLGSFVESKRRIAHWYNEHLSLLPGVSTPQEAPWARSTYWLYTILLDPEKAKLTSRELMDHLAAKKIQARPFWRPAHQQKMYRDCVAYQITAADTLYRRGLALPCSVNLKEMELEKILEGISERISVKKEALIQGNRA